MPKYLHHLILTGKIIEKKGNISVSLEID